MVNFKQIRDWIKNNALSILVALLVAASGSSYYFYREYSGLKKEPDKAAVEEVNKLVAIVGKLIVLPAGETPTVATVADPEKLQDQDFFAKAKTGDKVLIYANAKKAILYNPETNKIVEVAPINIGATVAPTPISKPAPKF